jgi:hypothetical protein
MTRDEELVGLEDTIATLRTRLFALPHEDACTWRLMQSGLERVERKMRRVLDERTK